MTRFLAIPFVGKDWYPHAADLPCFSDPLANPKLAYLQKRTAELIKKGKVVIAAVSMRAESRESATMLAKMMAMTHMR